MAHEQTISETLTGITHGIKRLGILYFEKARLKTTEKITILLATIAFSAVMISLGLVFFVFVSIGVGHYLATTMAPHLAYVIIAAFYLLVIGIMIALRRRLFVDPIARFMSRLLVEEPEEVRAERLMNPGGGKKNSNAKSDNDSAPTPESTPQSPTEGTEAVDIAEGDGEVIMEIVEDVRVESDVKPDTKGGES